MPDWVQDNFTCLINDSYLITYSDLNTCNKSFDLPVNNGTNGNCDYCQQNITGPFFTNFSACLINDIKTRTNYFVDENYGVCCAITDLASDCYIDINASFANVTENQTCDFCFPNWIETLTNCQPDESKIGYYIDDNTCYNITNLISDLTGQPANNTYNLVCDFDGDGTIGSVSNINTASNLTIIKTYYNQKLFFY